MTDEAKNVDTSFLRPSEQPEEIGRLGGYRILSILGVGGMGIVFQAEDPRLNRPVAVKVMRPEEAASDRAKERFLREARAAGAIDHENVVTIFQVGEDQGVPFFAMPLLAGESLQRLLDRERKLDQHQVINIGRQVADGLSAAHACGMIHRDIKPDNIWIDRTSGRVKILDFGIARTAETEDDRFTLTGTVVGTPRYMSPEQASNESIDYRTDLFSLGSVLYHLASGQPPFDGKNVTATLMAVSVAEETPIVELVDGIHPELSILISALLMREREDRPQSAAEVAQALEAIQGAGSVHVIADIGLRKKAWQKLLLSTASVLGIVGFLLTAIFKHEMRETQSAAAIAVRLLAPVHVTSSTHESDYYKVGNLIDGSGITLPLTFANYADRMHDVATETNAWVTFDPGSWPSDYYANGPIPELVFDLGGAHFISHLVLWGYFTDLPSNNNEAKTLEASFSNDGGETFGNSIVIEHVQTGAQCETIDLHGSYRAEFVRLRITDNHFTTIDANGGDRVGLSEVRFIVSEDSVDYGGE